MDYHAIDFQIVLTYTPQDMYNKIDTRLYHTSL